MRLGEPFSGFYVTSGYLPIQIAFAIVATYFLMTFDYFIDELRQSLEIYMVCYGIAFFAEAMNFLIKHSNLERKLNLIKLCDYVYIVSATGATYYILAFANYTVLFKQQLKKQADLDMEYQLASCQQYMQVWIWFMMFVSNFFLNVLTSILFLFIASLKPYQKKVRILEIQEVPILAQVQDEEETTDGKQNLNKVIQNKKKAKDQSEDYLEAVLPGIRLSFFRYGNMLFLSFFAFAFSFADAEYIIKLMLKSSTNDNYSNAVEPPNWYIFWQMVLFLILLIIESKDSFSSEVPTQQIAKQIFKSLLILVTAIVFYQQYNPEKMSASNFWGMLSLFAIGIDQIVTTYQWIKERKSNKQPQLGSQPSQPSAEYQKVAQILEQETNVEMTDDIYCICYLSHYFLYQQDLLQNNAINDQAFAPDEQEDAINSKQNEINELQDGTLIVDEILVSQMFYKSLMIFTVQILMAYFVLHSFNDGSSEGLTFASSPSILVLRLLCAIFLHIQVFEEQNQGMRMIFYAKNQVYSEGLRNPMIVLGFMKVISSLFTEVCNIILISSEDNTLDIIKDFVALTIIAELDSIYTLTLKKNQVRERIDRKILYYNKSLEQKSQQGLLYWFWTVIYVVINKIYISFFYYFIPFSIPFLSYYSNTNDVSAV